MKNNNNCIVTMNVEKKKKSRIQGGWAAQQQQQQQPQGKASDGLKTSTTPFAAGITATTGCAWTPGPAKSIMTSEQQKFTYQNVGIKRDAETKIINLAGDYIISTEPNGDARIKLVPGFIEPSECDWIFEQLRSELLWQQQEVKKNGATYLQPRLTSWIGDVPYSYSGVTHDINSEWSPLLRMLKDRIEETTGYVFNSLLANLYLDGHDHVSWHCDDELELGLEPTIASLSFGDTRCFELRKKPQTFAGALDKENLEYMEYIKIHLDAGTLLVMDGAVQLDWQHRISQEYHNRGPRINLTFRFTMAK